MLWSLGTQIATKLKLTKNYYTFIYYKSAKTQTKMIELLKTLCCERDKNQQQKYHETPNHWS
jgi:hypothetical protein